MQIPDEVIIADAGGPDVLVGGTIEATLNSTLGLVGRASQHFREQSRSMQHPALHCTGQEVNLHCTKSIGLVPRRSCRCIAALQ